MRRTKVLLGEPRFGVNPPESAQYRAEITGYLGRWQGYSEAAERFSEYIRTLGNLGSSGIMPRAQEMLDEIGKNACPYEFSMSTAADMAVQFARERLAQSAVAEGFDWLAMMDDDMRGPVDVWRQLLANDVDICAPLMFMRHEPCYPVIYAVRGGWGEDGKHFERTTQIVRNYPKNKLVECDAVGFGAVLIKVDVLRKMPQPWFFTWDSTRGRTQTGEDVSFCIEARKHGFRVFCDTRIPMLHLGPRSWVGEKEYEARNPDLVKLRDVMGDWSIEKRDAWMAS